MTARLAALPFAAALALFGLIRTGRTNAFDEAVTRRLEGAVTPGVRTALHLAAEPGYPPLSRVLPVVAIAVAARLGGGRVAVVQGMAWGAVGMGGLLKRAVDRPRPDDPLRRLVSPDARGASFPSLHVLTYVACYGFLARTARRNGRGTGSRLVLPMAVATLIVLASLDRIAEGEHWPTDVFAAALLGTGVVLVLEAIEQRTRPTRSV